jgi:E3 ubiquitin-protein ligase RNF38/44
MAEAGREETDEMFARRLQQEEMGIAMNFNRGSQPEARHSQSSPLLLPGGQRQSRTGGTDANNNNNNNNNEDGEDAVNVTLHNEHRQRVNDRISLCAILTVNVPQVVACLVVLTHHWDDTPICDTLHNWRWKWWSFLSAFRMVVYSTIIIYMVHNRGYYETRLHEWHQLNSFKNIVDALGLVWFVVGNMWLFGDDEAQSCDHPERSPVYRLCAVMLLINYIQICLPCIVAFAMIPVFCFCMPCLIRILARIQGGRFAQTRGATAQDIESMPDVTISEDHLADGEASCPICLSELVVGESGRALRCKHLFHKTCVDEWLLVNATCPTCRAPIVEPAEGDDEDAAAAAAVARTVTRGPPGGNNNSNVTNSDGGGGGSSTGGLPVERELELRTRGQLVDGSDNNGDNNV